MNPEYNAGDIVIKSDGVVIGTAQTINAEQISQNIGNILRTKAGSFVGSNVAFGSGIHELFGALLPKYDVVEERTRGIRQYRSKKKRLQKKWRKRNLVSRTVYKDCTVTPTADGFMVQK